MPDVLIALRTTGAATVTLATSLPQPQPGQRLNHAEAVALDLINHARQHTTCTSVQWGQALTDADGQNALELARELITPEGYAYSVSPEVRNAARRVLGVKQREAV